MNYFIRNGLRHSLPPAVRLMIAKNSILSSKIMVDQNIMGNRMEGCKTRVLGLSYSVLPFNRMFPFKIASASITVRPSTYRENTLIVSQYLIKNGNGIQEDICMIEPDHYYNFDITTTKRKDGLSITVTITKTREDLKAMLNDLDGESISMGIGSDTMDNVRTTPIWHELSPIADLYEPSSVSFCIYTREKKFKTFKI